jgi:hypothetical protein
MPIDAYKNFALSTLAAGINSAATSLSVQSGHGARFPAVPFNATIYNSTDYTNAAEAFHAGQAEIVRVTARATDNFSTILRGQEGTTAVNLNTAGKTYTILAALTEKFFSDISSSALTALTYSSTLGLAFADQHLRRSLSLTGNITFTGSGYADGREITLFVTGDTVTRTIAFPSGWRFFGSKPSDIAANKVAVLSLQCTTGAESGVRAAWSVEA